MAELRVAFNRPDAARVGAKASDCLRDGRLEPLPPRFVVWLIYLTILAATDWSTSPDGSRSPVDHMAEAVAHFTTKGLIEPNDIA